MHHGHVLAHGHRCATLAPPSPYALLCHGSPAPGPAPASPSVCLLPWRLWCQSLSAPQVPPGRHAGQRQACPERRYGSICNGRGARRDGESTAWFLSTLGERRSAMTTKLGGEG